MANRVLGAGRCSVGSAQPLEGLPDRLAPGVARYHVALPPPALALHCRAGRPCRHHPPGHADAAAVSGEAVAGLNLAQGVDGWLEGTLNLKVPISARGRLRPLGRRFGLWLGEGDQIARMGTFGVKVPI